MALKTTNDLHLARKSFHFGLLIIVYGLLNSLPDKVCWMIYAISGISFVAWDFFRLKIPLFNQITLRYFGKVLRETERDRLSGVTFTIIGLGVIYFLFPKNIVLLSVLFLAVGDPLASLFGILYGQDKLFGKKSLQGSLAAFVFCTLAAGLFYHVKAIMIDHWIVVSILSGFGAAVAEALPIGKLDDNLTQLLLNASFLSFIFTLFGGYL